MKFFIFLTLSIYLTKINALWPLGANPYLTNVYKNMQLSGFADGLKPLGFKQRISQDAMMKPGYGRKLNGLLRGSQSSTSSNFEENETSREEFDSRFIKRRKPTKTTTTTTTTSSTATTTTTTSTTTTTPTTTTLVMTTTKKNYKKTFKNFYKPRYISLEEMSIAEKHKSSLLNMLKSNFKRNRERRPSRPQFSETRRPISLFKTHDLSRIKTTNLHYRIRPQPVYNPKKFGTLVIVNNNNNNNNLINGLDPIELEEFLRAHQDMTITELLNSNITERLKTFFELDEREIEDYMKHERATGLARKQPVYKLVDLRSKESHHPLKYSYYPNANGGVIVINNSNNNNNDYTIRKILSGEGINVNNNNEGVALNLPPEDIERLLKNAVIVNNDNNNNNAS